jgi:hypothetical protein
VIYVAVFFTCLLATVLFLCLLDLRPCGRTYGSLVHCRSLVGRRGHGYHVWELIPIEAPIRLWVDDRLYDRNLRAIMLEERIAMSVRGRRIVTT